MIHLNSYATVNTLYCSYIIKEAKWNAFFIYDRFMNLLFPCPFPSLVILSFLKQKRSLTKLGIKNMHATLYLL